MAKKKKAIYYKRNYFPFVLLYLLYNLQIISCFSPVHIHNHTEDAVPSNKEQNIEDGALYRTSTVEDGTTVLQYKLRGDYTVDPQKRRMKIKGTSGSSKTDYLQAKVPTYLSD
jgi:hypothetical protein